MGRRSLWSFLLFVLFGLLLFSSRWNVVGAQDDVEDEEDMEPMQESAGADEAASDVIREGTEDSPEEDVGDLTVRGLAPGVETIVLFPNNPNKLCPAGSSVDVLLGIHNGGETELFVSAIHAALILPEYRMIAQNLTSKYFNKTVAPGVQATFPYTFKVEQKLMPRDFSLAAQVVYAVGEKVYATAFYNGTVEVTEPSGVFSGETAFLVFLGLGLLALLGNFIYSQILKYTKKGTRRSAPAAKKGAETGTNGTDYSNEWLEGTAFAQKAKSVSQQGKAKKKKA
eukprot:TRINITY_DN4784_c0_g1_i1.p1 TRINITY_DN4784_c0_g1~~TRINITY_DN4784_c0_g1_i1.p1  ORF type:complete len:283 (+),score=64.55 TRINITY_DN4784_c0_g1_i1:94-942(+)